MGAGCSTFGVLVSVIAAEQSRRFCREVQLEIPEWKTCKKPSLYPREGDTKTEQTQLKMDQLHNSLSMDRPAVSSYSLQSPAEVAEAASLLGGGQQRALVRRPDGATV